MDAEKNSTGDNGAAVAVRCCAALAVARLTLRREHLNCLEQRFERDVLGHSFTSINTWFLFKAVDETYANAPFGESAILAGCVMKMVATTAFVAMLGTDIPLPVIK